MAQQPLVGQAPHYRGSTINFRRTILGSTPLDERSVRGRDLYLTTHDTPERQTSMSVAGFEHKNPRSEQPKVHALDQGATGTGRNGERTMCLEVGISRVSVSHGHWK